VAVTQQTTDRVAGHGAHWEAGRVKPPERYLLDLFHGHVRTWDQLEPGMKNALIKEGLLTPKAKIR